jgi:hypothetical protein
MLLSADGYRGDIVEAAGGCDRVVRGRLPCRWVDFGALGMRRPTVADYLTGVGIADEHFA